MMLLCISTIRAHRPIGATQEGPSSQQPPTSGLRPDWRKQVADDIPNADKRPSKSNSQLSVSQTRKVSKSQQPSKYHNNNSFFPPYVYSVTRSEVDQHGVEPHDEQIQCRFFYFYLSFFIFY